jgi:hypothetical protein
MFWNKKKLPIQEFFSTLDRLSFYQDKILKHIDVLIDVGCSDGRFTKSTRNILPANIRRIGIDPIPDYKSVDTFEFVNALVGSYCTEIDFSVSEDLFTSSKLYPGIRSIRSEQVRMDCLLKSLDVKKDANIFAKIDTQGADLECLESFGDYLSAIQIAIVEIQMKPFTDGMNFFSESIDKVSKLGFEVCEFLNPLYRDFDGTLGQVDLLLVPKNSIVLKELSW